MTKREPKKRIMEIVQQFNFLNGTYEEFQQAVASNKYIKEYAMIVHDRDLDKNNQPVEPHFHCVINMTNANSATTVSNWFKNFGIEVNNIEFAKGRFADMLAYLTHANAPDKFQYAEDEVVSNFEWQKEAENATGKVNDIYGMIERGEIREYNKTQYIPMRMYIENERKITSAFKWRAEKRIQEIQEGEGEGRMGIDVIYIEGESGAGKTTYAKMLCEEKGYSYCVSSSGNDLLQDYRGQDALILDDLRGAVLSATDLLKLLDNNTRSSVRSRYSNKWLYECRLIIITSVVPIREFFESFDTSDKEPVEQLKRRCETYIKMDKNRITFFAYDKKTKEYRVVGDAENSVLEQYQNKYEETAEKAQSFMLGSLKNVKKIELAKT